MDYDYIIVGSGGAGLYTALKAAEHGRVLIITKGALGGGSTPLAQGGIAAAIGPEDSDELHQRDTLAAGRGLCNQRAVAVLAQEAPECIEDLISLGVTFDHDGAGIALGLEGAHSVPRVVHAGGDATGLMLQLALEKRLEQADRITVLDKHFVTELAVNNGLCEGVVALDLETGEREELGGRFVVLATGGFGQLYAHTTNSAGATGDGIAMAFRAGAAVADMEFFQFHPTVLCLPNEHRFLISEAVRGEGAILRDVNGRAFMKDYDPRGELAPRDVVTRAILREMEQTKHPCVYLDVTHLPEDRIRFRFPSIYNHCQSRGIDMTRSLVPVAPAAHYAIGGVKTNLCGETTIRNLFACGEVACTGVHGANRLASNSLIELLVFGRRVVQRTTQSAAQAQHQACEQGEPLGAYRVIEEEDFPVHVEVAERGLNNVLPTLQEIQSLAWEKLGPVRDGMKLDESRKQFTKWLACSLEPTTPAHFELRNLILIGRLVAEAAAIRCESRGTHYRADHPDESASWLRHIVLLKGQS